MHNNVRYRELRDKEIQMQTQGYVSRFEPPLYIPAFTQKDFNYPLKIFHKGTSIEELQLTTRSIQLQLSHTSTQEGRHKAKHKTKKRLQLGDHLDHKKELGDRKDHKQNTSNNTRS